MLPPPGFRDLKLCGAGATSRVFYAVSARTGEAVALKRLHRQLAQTPEALSRLKRELEALARLDHPSIVRVLDVIRWGGDPTVVMEFVPGRDLKDLLQTEGPLPIDRAERIARDLLEVLHAAHSAGIVHRDVKPQNVRIDAEGRTFLLDFGSARLEANSDLTATGTTVGTPDYMAPELFAGSVYDPRADIYGFGATMFEALTGRAPQLADNLTKLAYLRTHEAAPPVGSLRSDVPNALAQVVDRCLRQAPEDRYQDAAQTLWALQHPLAERRFQTRLARRPSCLHCHTPIAAEANLCPACGSDHPFCFDAGTTHLNLLGVDRVEPFVEEMVAAFPEQISSQPHLFQRLAALDFDKQRIVSFINREEAKALATRLEAVGARCELEEDRGLSGSLMQFLLIFAALFCGVGLVMNAASAPLTPWLLLLLPLPAAAIQLSTRWLALHRGQQGILTSAATPTVMPALDRLLTLLTPLLAVLAVILPAIGRSVPGLGLLTGLGPTLLTGALTTGVSVALVRRIGFSRRRLSAGSPEPSAVEKAWRALSHPEVAKGMIKPKAAIAVTALVLILVPAELAAVGAVRTIVPSAWSMWAQTDVTFTPTRRLPSERLPLETIPPQEVLPTPTPDVPIDPLDGTEPLPQQTLRVDPPAPSALTAWLKRIDPVRAATGSGILLFNLGLLIMALRRRRQLKEAGRRLQSSSELDLPLLQPPASRQPASHLLAGDRIAARASDDQFVAGAKRQITELAPHLAPKELRALEQTLDRIEQRHERSFLARCILESDRDQALRFELLRLTGRMETVAAERWAACLPEADEEPR